MLIMFLALFGATSWIQVVEAEALTANPANKRALYDSYEVQRGAIIAGGIPIATSVPSGDLYSWQRVYTDPQMWAPVTGYINPVLNSATGLEQAMSQQLSSLAREQRDIAQKLGGMNKGAGRDDLLGRLDDLVKEADDVARDLEGGRLTPQTLQRQGDLFHRLSKR